MKLHDVKTKLLDLYKTAYDESKWHFISNISIFARQEIYFLVIVYVDDRVLVYYICHCN